MAIASTYNFSTSRDELIKAALRKLGVLAEGQVPTPQQYTDGSEVLNMMVKAWQAEGMPLWARTFIYLLPVTGTNTYEVSPTASATYHAVRSFSTNTVGADLAISGTALTLSDSVTTVSGDYVGLEQDDGTMHWTTTTTAATGTAKTLVTGPTVAVSEGARVYIHSATAFAQKPLQLMNAWSVNMNSNDQQIPINVLALADVENVMNTYTKNIPINIAYIPSQNSPLSAGTSTFYIWPRFYTGDYYLKLDCQYPFADFDSSTDEPDFPQEFYEAIVYGLAIRLAPEFGYPIEDRMILKNEAEKIKENAFDSNQEMTSMNIQPARR